MPKNRFYWIAKESLPEDVEKLLHFLGDEQAVVYCIDVVFIAHKWDDLVDKDKELSTAGSKYRQRGTQFFQDEVRPWSSAPFPRRSGRSVRRAYRA